MSEFVEVEMGFSPAAQKDRRSRIMISTGTTEIWLSDFDRINKHS